MTQTMIVVAIACAVAVAGAVVVWLFGRSQSLAAAQPQTTEAEMDRAFTPRSLSAREMYEGTTKGAILSAIARIK